MPYPTLDAVIEDLSALKFLYEIGVDEWIGDAPINRLQLKQDAPKPENLTASPAKNLHNAALSKQRNQPDIAPPPPIGRVEAIQNASDMAKACQDLQTLRAAITQFKAIDLANTATQGVMGHFPENPALTSCFGKKILFMLDMPDDAADRSGDIFTGSEGALLKAILVALEIDIADIFVSFAVFWRPPGKRSPLESELKICTPFLSKMMELCAPNYIVLMGKYAHQTLMGKQGGSYTSRMGTWQAASTLDFFKPLKLAHTPDLLYCPSPKYLISTPQDKAQAWQTLLSLKHALITKN